jgi:Tol biopolymer transport system component
VTVSAGTRLGPYEILAPLGAGGMGEVYRAKDTRLDRTVAVKVLPQHLSSSAEVRQRFEREAKAIAALSHPHICALYDVGREGETEYLVMELLEGETLATRLLKGALPTDQTLSYGIQIADALDKAHRQGIVHRDLKPGNVMLTKSGVKLLDFGLAKAVAPPQAVSALTSLPTMAGAQNLTEKGTILGTFQYMAPEQLEGKEADARSDIFAFGAVLYEMATGKKAFSGTSQASLISAIMKEDPAPISTVQKMTPPALDRVVRTCLAKDPDERWQSAGDLKGELKWIAEGSQAGVPAPVAARRKGRERLAWALFAAAAIAAAVFAGGYFRRAPRPGRSIRTAILLPEKRFLNFLAISPDGARLAFVAGAPGGKRQLWVRPLDGLSAEPLAGTESADFPFWSPDGRSIGFFADGKLKRIEAAGGPAVVLCNAGPNGIGGTWSRQGVILFSYPAAPINRIPETGGTPTPVTTLDEGRHETTHRYPWFLPDGRHFLYVAANLAGAPDDPANLVRVGTIDAKDDRPLIPAYSNAIYAPSSAGASDGYLLFQRDGSLFAQPFDQARLQAGGQALPIAQHVANFNLFWRNAIFCAAENGSVAYGAATTIPSPLLWFDRNGRQTGTAGESAFFTSGQTSAVGRLRISPDGRQLAATVFDPSTRTSDVWIYDLVRGTRTRLTSGPASNADPLWSPDGRFVLFDSDRKHQGDLYRKATGAGGDEPVLEGEGQRIPDDWSPDGRSLAVEVRDPRGSRAVSLSILSLSDDGKLTKYLQRGTNNGDARFSPDGRWIAYTSDESGRSEVYVGTFPGPAQRWQISTDGATQPRWRRDSKELYYLSSDLRVMSVEIVSSGSTLEAGKPSVLFEPHPLPAFFDTTDGQRFLIMSSGVEQSPPITFVQNWAAETKK